MQQPGQRGAQQGQHDLGLRVAEAAVELDHRRSGRGQRQPGVEQPAERGAAAGQLGGDRGHHVGDQLGGQLRRRPRQRGVGAHPAGVRAAVVVADPLEVLGRQQRHHGLAVDQAEQRHLRPVQVGLQQHRVAVVEQGAGVRPGHVEVRADHDALAGGQPVVLDHVGRVEPGQRGVQVRRVVDDLGAGRAHPGRGHHVLGEALGALDPGGRRARAEAGDPGGAHRVGDPGDQRHLRSDDHQVGLPASGQGAGRRGVQHVQAVLLGHPGGAGVAGCAGQRGHRGVLGHGQDDGVLTSTGAHDEDAHEARS